tara:strand:+ start:89836 stop:90051 length:216 start_codon:yes stop_codon:yes gene_type:complete
MAKNLGQISDALEKVINKAPEYGRPIGFGDSFGINRDAVAAFIDRNNTYGNPDVFLWGANKWGNSTHKVKK